METPGNYLSAPQTTTPEQIASCKQWLLAGLGDWKRAFRPDALALICMAVALEEIAGILRQEAAHSSHASPSQSTETPR